MNRHSNGRNPMQVRLNEASIIPISSDAAPWQPSRNAGAHDTETRMLRLADVVRRTGLGKTKIYELQKAGLFPMSVNVTDTAVRWIDSEVEAWLMERARARYPTSSNR
jgi:prophage regulatory protein